jgi:hypothetical protein
MAPGTAVDDAQPMNSRPLVAAALVVGILAYLPTGPVGPASVSAFSATTLYVDGKHGNDTNSGLSWSQAFRTINRAAREIPHDAAAAGWTVIVRGYTDYAYRERPVPGAYDRVGTAQAALVFMAEGWSPGATDYVKPIISGADRAPRPGQSWHSYATGVWWTSWSEKPSGFDRAKPYTGAVFQEMTTRLWQHASLSDLRQRAPTGRGGYWWDDAANRLYVATRRGVKPGSVSIEVPLRSGFYFTGRYGGRHISVRGFAIRHAAMAVAFHRGADYNSVLDVDAVGSTPMAFTTAGDPMRSGFDPAVGNQFLRTSASYGTLQGYKVDAGSRDTVICDSGAANNALQGIKVQGPADAGDPRITSGTEICRTLLVGQDTQRLGAGRGDEVPNGLTVSNGARGSYIHNNVIRGNTVGIQVNQRGDGGPVDHTRLFRNEIFNNGTGLNLRDGVASRFYGSGSWLGRFNVYWHNGVGIYVATGSTNKTFEHETVYDSVHAGVQVGCTCGMTASITIRESLVTHSGSYGVLVAAGQHVRLSYVGLPMNRFGGVSGAATKDHVNTKRPRYLSLDSTSADFVRIGPSSFQYTAGPSSMPIGARY